MKLLSSLYSGENMLCVLSSHLADVLVAWTAMVFIVVVVMVTGPSYAYSPRYQSRVPPSSLSSIRSSPKTGVGSSMMQHYPPMMGGTQKNDVGGGDDLRQEWTSSAYCRNSVDYHEEFVRMSSGSPIGASKVFEFTLNTCVLD